MLKSFRTEVYQGKSHLPFPDDAIWKSKAPTKACFLAWAATKGKIRIEDMFKREILSWLASVRHVSRRKGWQIAFRSVPLCVVAFIILFDGGQLGASQRIQTAVSIVIAVSLTICNNCSNAEITSHIAGKTRFSQPKTLSNTTVSSRIRHILNPCCATSSYNRGFSSLEKKVKEDLGNRSLEVHAIDYLVENLEGEELSDFCGQGQVYSRFQALLLENVV